MLSLSSRRAWIEIKGVSEVVAQLDSRSPHGERGLKSVVQIPNSVLATVALLTESVD